MKKNRILAALLALTLCLALAACGGDKTPPPEEGGDSKKAVVNVGFIGPLTGPAAQYGDSAKKGADIAVAEIKAMTEGKLEINLIAMDDEHDPEKAVSAYRQLQDKDAQAIIGCVTTSPCLTVAEVAMADRMFMLTPSASSPMVVEGRDNVYQLCFSDTTMGIESAEYIQANNIATKVAVIYNSSDAYSTGIYNAFKTKAAEIGLDVVAESAFPDDNNTDYTVQIKAAQTAGAELIFLPIYYGPASLIMKQAADMNYNTKFFGCDGLDGLLGIDGFDLALAEGAMLLTPFNADATDEATKKFVETYKAQYNQSPSQFAADGYDCVYAIYNACLQSEKDVSAMSASEMCDFLIETFSSEEFVQTGLTGENMTWKKNGEISKNTTVFEVVDGKYAPMT